MSTLRLLFVRIVELLWVNIAAPITWALGLAQQSDDLGEWRLHAPKIVKEHWLEDQFQREWNGFLFGDIEVFFLAQGNFFSLEAFLDIRGIHYEGGWSLVPGESKPYIKTRLSRSIVFRLLYESIPEEYPGTRVILDPSYDNSYWIVALVPDDEMAEEYEEVELIEDDNEEDID